MLFNYRFAGSSTVTSSAHMTGMSFAPDTLRDSAWFVGKLHKKLAFREAISALHDVVISDLRFKPKDKTAYKEWVAENEAMLLADHMAGYDAQGVSARIEQIKAELADVRAQKNSLLGPYHTAKSKYFNYIYEKERDKWIVLDPVITIHPDELFFECFSEDESTYGKLGCNYNVFKEIGDYKCGTTNVDYSAGLYEEFQKIRDYKETELKVDPSGFTVQTTREEAFKEVKIDLPDSWVRGFLQVSSAMTLPTIQVDLHPMDIHSLCLLLRRFREKRGPRALRYVLEPGHPVKLVLEPWGKEIVCARSIYTGPVKQEIRTWGRRRLLILERLIPVAKKFTVHLLGTGLPTFYIADLGDMNFTLGLSGWTTNDWSHAGNFDLLAPRLAVDDATKQKVFGQLQKDWLTTSAQLAQKLHLDTAQVAGALSAYTQAGRVIYDLNSDVYRLRELSRDLLPMDKLRFSNPQEELAAQLLASQEVKVTANAMPDNCIQLAGSVKGARKTFKPQMVIDGDEKIKSASCDCSYYIENKLYKGPCEHMLAIRQSFNNTRVAGNGFK
ncbi:SWIM zinc finger family protein [Paraflavitalea sp. CAU 1676]|uniref:SWIM zinc finger family protein n=1 Tax=Paraflavitalea sp. CAU 1676 TaxID=3032598 RepID=UPI0023DC658A|nr:SWIM zinc finger family protein [Paraflavitalea sp. CAU 1676]MDF2189243.1 SWIM zinc finger family protein [Paraflavitalea sp. CAU 1676]